MLSLRTGGSENLEASCRGLGTRAGGQPLLGLVGFLGVRNTHWAPGAIYEDGSSLEEDKQEEKDPKDPNPAKTLVPQHAQTPNAQPGLQTPVLRGWCLN